MAHGKLVFAAAVVAAASLSAFAGTSQAVVYTEGPDDAGQTLATAQVIGANATGISGLIGFGQDADLYQLTLAAGTYTFSSDNAGTNDITAGGALDTAIFLFDGTGAAILTNDDANGFDVGSSLKATLAAGTYYFGISLSGNEPINGASQLLFAGYPGGDTTATRGPASGIPAGMKAETNFNSNSYTDDLGTYNVTITAAVPEPSTWAVVGASAVALAFFSRRRVA